MNLQRAAGEAVRMGIQGVDELLKKQRRFKSVAFPDVQCALIAIDPHTAEVKALVGGRNYGMSQLNHILAKRQPGSIFKPFVYAAAMNTGITPGAPVVLTPASMVIDEPTTFWFDDKPYEPNNFTQKFLGEITLREALAHSINVPAVKVAEMVGYDTVVDLAKNAGMNLNRARHALGRARRLRSHADRDGRRLHRFFQRRRVREAEFHLHGAGPKQRDHLQVQAGIA